MSQPVKIVVTAETAEAAAALKQFVNQANSGLASMASATGAIGKSAEEAGVHVAGMSYYFRSGMDQIRFALAGGGARAGFYAMDEAVRGLVASGMKLSELVPIIGGLAIVVGGGIVIWDEFVGKLESAAEKAKNLTDALEKIPGLMKSIYEAQKVGGVTPEQAQKYADYLSGKTPLYVATGRPIYADTGKKEVDNENINLTEQSRFAPQSHSRRVTPVQLEPATLEQINAYVEQQRITDMASNAAAVRVNEVSQAQDEQDKKLDKADTIKSNVESENKIREQALKDFAEANKTTGQRADRTGRSGRKKTHRSLG